jgi:hypothetical protein
MDFLTTAHWGTISDVVVAIVAVIALFLNRKP